MSQESKKMPEVSFGEHRISRLIVGSNQQNGASHQSMEMNRHMLEYFTLDQTVAFVRDCLAQGIDTWQANYNEKTRDVLRTLREEGDDIKVIPFVAPPTPSLAGGRLRAALERMADQWDKIFEELKPIGMHLVGFVTDLLWREGKIDTARDFLAKIRDSGVQVGVSTHIPEVIAYIEEKGWDVDYYLASLYKWQKTREEILSVLPEVPLDGHGGWEIYLPSELAKMLETIRAASKTCLAFKLFAGGRACSTPAEVGDVFANVLEHIKPGDAVIVGMYPRFNEQMVKENADHVKRLG